MKDIDQKIRAALRGQPGADELDGEPNLAEEVIIAFRGRNRWLSTVMFMMNIVLFAGAVWAVVRFLGAEDVTAQLRWGGLALLLFLAVSFVKVWFWLEMQANRVLREVKRVELLLLAQRPEK